MRYLLTCVPPLTVTIPLNFPVIPCAQQFTGVHLKTSQKQAPKPHNSSEHLRTFPITFGNRFEIVSEDFRTLPKISEDFPKILKSHKNI